MKLAYIVDSFIDIFLCVAVQRICQSINVLKYIKRDLIILILKKTEKLERVISLWCELNTTLLKQ